MLNASNAFKRLLYEGKRNYLERVNLVLGSGKELTLTNKDLWEGGLSFEDAVSDDNTFEIGAAIINKCTITINNIYDDFSEHDFANAEATVYVGLELPDGTREPIRKGTFAVDEPKYNGGVITLSCLDNMRKFDKPYSESALIYPATLGQIVRDACSKCDVILRTDTFPHHDHIVNERPADEATTFREVISWAAQIAGCFCRCDVYGRLELKWYDQEALEVSGLDGGIFDKTNPSVYESGDNADGGSFRPWNIGYEADGGTFAELNKVHHITSNYSMDISTDDVVITGIRVLEKTKEEDKDAVVTYQSGTDGYVISIENNALIQGGAGQQIAEWLGQQLIGFRFRRANVSHPSDPTMEAGDVGFLTDRKGNTYRIVVSCTRFSTGGNQSTVSSAQNPARNSAARFSAETKNYVENRKIVEKERTDRERAIEQLNKALETSSGLYRTEDPPGAPNAVQYLHDKPTIAESKTVIKVTSEAIGISNDGGKTYPYGLTLDDGTAILNKIYAIGIDASYINSGEIKVGPTGRETFYADYKTGTVRIVADSFSLTSGKTIEGIAQEAASNKNKVFTSTPTPPYNVGDLWVQGANGDIMRCNAARASGSYVSTDWALASKYTDDSTANVLFAVTNEKIESKVSKGNLSSEISQEAGKISIKSNRLSIDSTNFKLTEAGAITSTSGTIGGFTIGTSKIYATSTDSNKRVIVMQAGKTDSQTAFAAGGHDHSNYSDCPFRVSMAGRLYANGAVLSGNITATSGSFGGVKIDYANANDATTSRLHSTIGGGANFYIGAGTHWNQAFVLYNSGGAPVSWLLNDGSLKCLDFSCTAISCAKFNTGGREGKTLSIPFGNNYMHFKNGLLVAYNSHSSLS